MSVFVQDEDLGIDWTNDSEPFLVELRRLIFSRMQVEVRPNVFVPYDPHPGQQPVHFPEEGEEWQFFVGSAGQRAGKTITASAECAWRLGLPGQRIWYIAPTYDLANRAFEMIHEFVVRQQVHGPGTVVSASKPSNKPETKSIEMAGGSFLRTKSAENANSLLGEKLTFAVVDEAALLDLDELWSGYVLPRLVNLKGKALIISSPRGLNAFSKFWQRGKEEETRETGWRSAKFKTEDNPYVDKKWLEDQRLVTPRLTWKRDFEGEFVSPQGMVYDMYRDELLPKGHLFRPQDVPISRHGWTHFLAIDIGIRHPTYACWGAVPECDIGEWVYENGLYIYKEYMRTGGTHLEHARNIAALTDYPVSTTWISPDAARTLPLSGDTALSALHMYSEAGVYAVPASDEVAPGISLVQQCLKASRAARNTTTHQRLYISVECEAARQGFLTYAWQGQAGRQRDEVRRDLPEKPRKYKDDPMDGVRYLVAGKPRYEVPLHWSEEEGFDPQGREGYAVGQPGAPQFRTPGVDWS